MSWAASSESVSGSAVVGSLVIHFATCDDVRFSPEAAARSTSRSVKMPSRAFPCMTRADPKRPFTIAFAVSATDASRVVLKTSVVMISRSVATVRTVRLMASRDTTEGMSRGGYYDSHSEYQRAVAESGAELIRRCVDATPLPDNGESYVVADYGCSTGANSITAVT